MKGYESYFRKCQNPDYTSHYVDYGLLKGKLAHFYDRRRQLNDILEKEDGRLTVDAFSELTGESIDSASSLVGNYYVRLGGKQVTLVESEDALLRLNIIERKSFSLMLEQQMGAAAIFYSSSLLPGVQHLIENNEYDAASAKLLETIAFACTNIITFRQSLIRYDAFCRTFNGMPLTEWHLGRSCLEEMHPVHGFFRLQGVEDLEKKIVIGLQRRDAVMDGGMESEGGSNGKGIVDELTSQIQMFVYILEKTGHLLEKAVAGQLVFKDRLRAWMARIQGHLLFGLSQSRGLLEPQPKSMRGRHLKRELKIIGKWMQTKNFAHFSIEEDKRGTFRKNLKEIDQQNIFPLFLNLVSCFLFMMNNYIIEPSSAYYAEALGSSDALSGLMIGAAPWFALASSVAYSYWTNYNYKQPILFAGLLQFIGNLMYANAYGYQSVSLCLVGRAITGLGAPRIINRRYVADATPFSLRTAASAAFAMATALGAASGPGIAILLDQVDEFQFYLPMMKVQYFNGMTGPGYFMALNWCVYTLCIVFFFNEPTRSGLEELEQREKSDDLAQSDCKRQSLLAEVELAVIDGDNKDHVIERNDSMSFDGDECHSIDGIEGADKATKQEKSQSNFCYCCYNITRPVIVCMSLIFMKRIALESIVGSTSVITKNRYGWSIKNVGTLHLVNGIVVIPVSALSGYLSAWYEDRLMSIWFLAITLFGMVFLFDPTDLWNTEDNNSYNEGHPFAVGPIRYITGSLIAFSGIEACESYVASLMSKVVPSSLAKGTFNSGLLATLVGTGGRATGDLFITLMGLISIRNLLNLLIIPGASLVVVSIIMIRYNYDVLGV